MPNKGFLGPSSQPAKLTRILRHCRASIPHHECIYKQIFINFLLQRQRSPLPNASVFTQGQLPCHFDEEVGIFKAAERVDGGLRLGLDHLRARADAVQADERVFVLVHVRGLAKLVRVAQNVEHIVTDLERKAKVLRVGLRGLKLLRSSVRSHDADRHNFSNNENLWINIQHDPDEARSQLVALRRSVLKLTGEASTQLLPGSGRLRTAGSQPIEAVCDAESLLVWSIAATPNIGSLKVWEYDAKGGDWRSLADAQQRAREPSARLMRFTSLPMEKTLSLN